MNLNRIAFANAQDAWVDAAVGAEGAHDVVHPAAEVVIEEPQAQLQYRLWHARIGINHANDTQIICISI